MIRIDERKLNLIAPTMFWGSIVAGLTQPWLTHLFVETTVRHGSLPNALSEFTVHFMAPGYNYFLIGVMNAIPFVVYAVAALFLLGPSTGHGEPAFVYGRLAGLLLAGTVAFGASLWTHLSVLVHPHSTSAIAYLFLPGSTLALMPFGYIGGWFWGRWLAGRGEPGQQQVMTSGATGQDSRTRIWVILIGWLISVVGAKGVGLLFLLPGMLIGSGMSHRTSWLSTFILSLRYPRMDGVSIIAALIGGYVTAHIAGTSHKKYIWGLRGIVWVNPRVRKGSWPLWERVGGGWPGRENQAYSANASKATSASTPSRVPLPGLSAGPHGAGSVR